MRTHTWVRHSVVRLGILATVLVAAIAATAGSAAAFDEFSGSLAGKTWKSDNFVEPAMRFIIAGTPSGLAICVAPNQGSSFPYGWACHAGEVSWEFTPLSAAAAVDNPNSKSFTYSGFSSQT